MNQKGFTLIELLATIVILSIVMGIASVGVTSYIKTSKAKSEKIYVEKVSNLIDDYIDLKGSGLSKTTNHYTFKKCDPSRCEDVEATELESIYLNDLITANLVLKEDMINPKNKENCLDDEKNPEVKIYKDSDYVYYYYVDLSGNNTSCDISKENSLINSLPDNLIKALINEGVAIPDKLKEKVGE